MRVGEEVVDDDEGEATWCGDVGCGDWTARARLLVRRVLLSRVTEAAAPSPPRAPDALAVFWVGACWRGRGSRVPLRVLRGGLGEGEEPMGAPTATGTREVGVRTSTEPILLVPEPLRLRVLLPCEEGDTATTDEDD